MQLPRFGLRALFVAVAICGCLTFWITSRVRNVQKARQVIEQRGGSVTRFHNKSRIDQDPWFLVLTSTDVDIRLSGKVDQRLLEAVLAIRHPIGVSAHATDFNDEHLRQLCVSPTIRCLYLNGTHVTDQGIRHLCSNTVIDTLGLSGTQITDVGVQYLAKLTQLTTLELRETSCRGITLDQLQETQLSDLNLAHTPLDDDAIPRLSALKRLRSLDVSYTDISPSALANFEGLAKLEYLNVAGLELKGRAHFLSNAVSLIQLDLRSTGINDNDLALILQHSPRLQRIELNLTAVTHEFRQSVSKKGVSIR